MTIKEFQNLYLQNILIVVKKPDLSIQNVFSFRFSYTVLLMFAKWIKMKQYRSCVLYSAAFYASLYATIDW